MKILIIGGRGMVGKAICSKLSKHNIHTFDRHDGPKNHIQGNILKPFDVYSACKGMDYVINLVGLSPLRKPKGISYQQAHVNGVINILEGCHKHKCNLIHISALGAKKTGPTEYLRSKGRGEELIKLSGVKHTILRPSLIYSKDHELNKIVDKYSWTRMFLNIPAKIQPICKF